jgi:hypothetical protein
MPVGTGQPATAPRPVGDSRRPRAIAAAQVLLTLALALLWWAGAGGLAAGDVRANPVGIGAFVAQGGKLLAAGEMGDGHFGRSVALSADGSTALIGGPRDSAEAGAVWVFTRSGSTWTQQAKLEVGKAEGSSYFGRGVALSADGSTALIGDPGNGSNTGAAWVFTRSGSTWTKQTRLEGAGEVGAGQFGRSVALGADGSTALVGAFADNGRSGAAWVFTRSGSTWAQQGSKLTGGGEVGPGYFGRSVALAADGATALIGGTEDDLRAGAAWVFTRSGTAWPQQGSKLTGGGESGKGQFGVAVALSGDGSTALVGGAGDGSAGAAWVFARSGPAWAQQGPKLTGGGEVGPGAFGFSVSLSGDGSTALVGGLGDAANTGAAWVFARSGTAWAQQGSKLSGAGEVGEGLFGYGVALSADATTALVGGIGDNGGVGAAWVFVEQGEGEPSHEQERPHEETLETQASKPPASSTPPAGSGGVLAATFVADAVLGRSGTVEPVSGRVFLRLPHSRRFVLLAGLRQIPFGTVIDATAGRVLVTTARPHGGSESGEFFAGEFALTQRYSGVVTATLAGGDSSVCPPGRPRADRASASVRRASGRHTVRRLWANAHGTFSTKGNYAAGAVQGTEWLTEDRCEGTVIRVTRDKVKVTDLVRHRSFTVRAGHSVLVRGR